MSLLDESFFSKSLRLMTPLVAVIESRGKSLQFVSLLFLRISPSFFDCHSPENPGRRFLPVRSCCMRACLRRVLAAIIWSRVSRARSQVARMSAILRCSGRGGSGMGSLENSDLFMMGTAWLPAQRAIFAIPLFAALSRKNGTTSGPGMAALICWLAPLVSS